MLDTTLIVNSPERLGFQKFLEFPWIMKEISEPGRLISPTLSFQNLIAIEDCHFSPSQEVQGFKIALGAKVYVDPALGAGQTIQAFQMACSYLVVYRLLDINYGLQNEQKILPAEPIRRFKLSTEASTIFLTANNYFTLFFAQSVLFRLTEWPEILRKFRDVFAPDGQMIRAKTLERSKNLLDTTAHVISMTKYYAVCSNFCVALVHLRAMLSGRSTHLDIPDLPRKGKLMSFWEQAYGPDNPVRRCLSKSPNALRGPLQAATLVTPIILLVARRLDNEKFNKETLFNIFFFLRTWRPQTVRLLEDQIWRCLFQLATALNPTFDDVLSAVWDILQSDAFKAALSITKCDPGYDAFRFQDDRNGSPAGPVLHFTNDMEPADIFTNNPPTLLSLNRPLDWLNIPMEQFNLSSPNLEVENALSDNSPWPDDCLMEWHRKNELPPPIPLPEQLPERRTASPNQCSNGSIQDMEIDDESLGSIAQMNANPLAELQESNLDARPSGEDQMQEDQMQEDQTESTGFDVRNAPKDNTVTALEKNLTYASAGEMEGRKATPCLSDGHRMEIVEENDASGFDADQTTTEAAATDSNNDNTDVQGEEDNRASAELDKKDVYGAAVEKTSTDAMTFVLGYNSLPSSDEEEDDVDDANYNINKTPPKVKTAPAPRTSALGSGRNRRGRPMKPLRKSASLQSGPIYSARKPAPAGITKASIVVDDQAATEGEDDYEEIEEGIFIKMPRCTLDLKEHDKVPCETDVIAHTATGIKVVFQPNVHNIEIRQTILSLSEAVKRCYRDGTPLHCHPTAKAESVFHIVSEAEFDALTDKEVQNIFRRHHIVIYDQRHKEMSFGQAVHTLGGGLDRRTDIQDQSLPLEENRNNIVHCGTIGNLLTHANSPTGNALNALNFPMTQASMLPTTYASDTHALLRTTAMITTTAEKNSIPMAHFRFGTLTTEGGFQEFHLDSNGLATYVCPITGQKWLIVARPTGNLDFSQFEDLGSLLVEAFDINGPGDGLFDLEAILLEPGTTLIMRPNTLHAVYTPKNCVVHGGHFFATSTMRDTLAATFHTFILHELMTNTDHPPAYAVIRRLIDLYHSCLVEAKMDKDDPARDHIPDLHTEEGLIDLLSICTIGKLLNVIDFRTYGEEVLPPHARKLWNTHDVTPLPLEDRLANQISRGQCRQLLEWADANYAVVFTDGQCEERSILDVHKELFKHHLHLLQCYKFSADESEKAHRPTFDAESFTIQLEAVGKHSAVQLLETHMHVGKMVEADRKLFNLPAPWTIKSKAEKTTPLTVPAAYSDKIKQLLDLGSTERDISNKSHRAVKLEGQSQKKRKI